ncbi:hypothetical protein Tco_1072701 [Tanacetum coccineum]
MGCLSRSALFLVTELRSLTRSPNSFILGESLEIRDYLGYAIWKHFSYGEWSRPAGFQLAREKLQSRIDEEDLITNVENAIFDFGVMDPLRFLFVDQRILIGLITKLIKLVKLKLPVITRGFEVKVSMFHSPICVVLELDR